MGLETYLIFIGASLILCLVPGPDMIYLLGRALGQGKKAGLLAALGINAGAYVHLIAAILGVSALLATSSQAFTLFKWLGALYLTYLGLRFILSRQAPLALDNARLARQRYRTIFWQGFLSDVLNPKVALFYLAFLPQFIEPAAANPTAQMLLLGITLNMIGIATSVALVYASTGLITWLGRNSRITAWGHKLTGGLLVSLGIKLALEEGDPR